MTPAEQAAAVYEREWSARSFTEDVEAHLLCGFLFSTPAYFIMGRAVNRYMPPELILDPWFEFDPESVNTWLIYLAAGTLPMSGFLQFEPFPLPWLAWEKRNRLRFYDRSRILGRLNGSPPSTVSF